MRARLARPIVLLTVLFGLCLLGIALAQTVTSRTDIFKFLNGIRVGTIAALDGSSPLLLDATGLRLTMPAIQTIATTNTIVADACGGVKRITAASAIGTNTTDTFTAPGAANAGCWMLVCNVGATNTITLDNNAHFASIGGADIALTANDCTAVFSDGTIWRSAGSLVAN